MKPKILVIDGGEGRRELIKHILSKPKTYSCFNCNNKNKECKCTGYTDPTVKPSGWRGKRYD